MLDVGCGTCAHTVRLATRGAAVHGIDVSFSMLSAGRSAVAERGLSCRVALSTSSLRALPFRAGTFDGVLCWGVLMHVPDVAGAIAEIARVVRPGRCVVISESNRRSLQSLALAGAKRLLRREKADVRRTPGGTGYWVTRQGGALVTRETDAGWLVEEFGRRGLRLETRRAGQFSELYTRTGSPAVKALIHRWNRFWFERIRTPGRRSATSSSSAGRIEPGARQKMREMATLRGTR